ncbi:hypothetical protein Tco_0096952 [Tanacetum coccineum]
MAEMKKVLLQRPQGALPEEIKAITIRSGNVLARPSVPPPIPSSSEEEPSPSFRPSEIPPSPTSSSSELPKRNPHQPQIPYPLSLAEALALMPKYHKMLKDLLSDKEKLLGLANTSLTENCSAVLLKKLLEKLGDLGKFLIPCDFPKLEKCIALSDLGANTNLMPLSLILRDGDEKLIFHADSTSKHPQKHVNESINMINFINITCEDRFEEVLKIKKSNHPFSGSTTSPSDNFPSLTPFKTSDSLLEEFTDELALLDPFPPGNEDDNFDPEADLRENEYLLNRDPSTDSSPTTDIDIIDPIFERFTNEPILVYSSPPRDDDDDLFDLKSDNDEWKKLLYGDNFNDIHSEKDKIKDSKMKILINELELLNQMCYFLSYSIVTRLSMRSFLRLILCLHFLRK